MHFIINKMKDLDNLIQNFIKNERIKLIKQLCNNETTLIGKEQHLINKYSDLLNIESDNAEMEICDESNNHQYLNISNENTNLDVSNENTNLDVSNENTNFDISNESVFEINSLSNQFDKLTLKELQKICCDNGVDIHKFSEKSGNKVNKSKKELLELIN